MFQDDSNFPWLGLDKGTAVIVSLLAAFLQLLMAQLHGSGLGTTVEVVIDTGAQVTCS